MNVSALAFILLIACAQVHAEGVMSQRERTQYSSMMKAIETNNLKAVESLIKQGTSLELREDSRASPTFITQAAYLGHTQIVDSLLAAGADIESMNGDAATALICAIKGNKTETTALLIRKGADVNTLDQFRNTPLSLARSLKNQKIVEMLVKAGAR